jgi:hypothetical protein
MLIKMKNTMYKCENCYSPCFLTMIHGCLIGEKTNCVLFKNTACANWIEV